MKKDKARFHAFLADLKALCLRYHVQLEIHGYGEKLAVCECSPYYGPLEAVGDIANCLRVEGD